MQKIWFHYCYMMVLYPNILNSEGNAPIVSAAIANRGDIVKLLLDEGADVKYLYKGLIN